MPFLSPGRLPLRRFLASVAGLAACVTLAAHAGPQADPPSAEVFDSITQSCRERMARNVIAPPAAAAYCYCYADAVTQQLTQADFERMGQMGPAERDRRIFKAAHRRCARPGER